MKKRILFTLPGLIGGGAERVMLNIIKSLDRERYDIKLLLIDRDIDTLLHLVPKDIELVYLDKKRTRDALFALIRKVRELKPDIIFSTTNRMNILVLLASFFLPKRIKIFVREPNLPSAQIKNGTLTVFNRVLISRLYPRSYKIVAQTPQMAEEIERYFGVEKEKIVTLINPVDKETIDKNIKTKKEIFDRSYTNFVAVGRLSRQKGFDLLIETMQQVVQKDPGNRLYIIGEGEDREKLEKLIEHLGLQEYVFLLGFQKNPHQYIKAADAFILSSRWEGLPNVVLEALYIGTFVIMSRVNPYVEQIIEEQQCGVLYDTEDKAGLEEYLLHLETYKKEAKCGYDFERPVSLFDEVGKDV